MSPQEFEKDQSPGPHLTDTSCYQSISLNKAQHYEQGQGELGGSAGVHEVLVTEHRPWLCHHLDFDVMRHDVMFCVFRTRSFNGLATTTHPTLVHWSSTVGPTADARRSTPST
eukprot:TRINITY_DN22671_c0_g1_i1.p1 TRINITY_DN22671_c0_g1~~TRINITY_DN22671_c0_g1_i1.p1  ORF type:complete len:113 (-),score=10.15 TRINITY_DN22671_c0_g1_i1:120-458(-)